jgi:predicted permease
MNHFNITFTAVAQMLAFAAPAYLLMRFKKFDEKSISVFVTLLLFVCQPCLSAYSLQKATVLVRDGVMTLEQMLLRGALALLLSFVLQAAFLALSYFVLRKRQQEAQYRIFVIAACFGNSGFFGTPILEAVMGQDHPEVAMFSALYSLVMNAMCWTVASTIITRNPKYISVKKIFFNPNTIAAAVTIIMMCFTFVLPNRIYDMVATLGTFSTPLCMFILGMRLALVDVRELFGNWRQYVVAMVKNVGFALFAFGAMYFIPVEGYVKQALFIICCCPVANMVLSFAEMLGKGQKTAANVVLLSTISSLVTLPLLCLLLPYLA